MRYPSLKAVPYDVLKKWFLEENKSGLEIQQILRVEHGLILSRSAVMGRLNRLGLNKSDFKADNLQTTAAASKANVEQLPTPKMPVKEMQASDLGLDSFGEFIDVKEKISAELAAKAADESPQYIKEIASSYAQAIEPKPSLREPPLLTDTEEYELREARKRLRKKVQENAPDIDAYMSKPVVITPTPVRPTLFPSMLPKPTIERSPLPKPIVVTTKLPIPEKRTVPIERTPQKTKTARTLVTPPDPYTLFRNKQPVLKKDVRTPTRHDVILPTNTQLPVPVVKKELAGASERKTAAADWAEIEELIFGPVPVREDGHKFLEHLKADDCRWIVSTENGKALYCAAKSPSGSIRLCDAHASMAFTGTSRTKAQETFDKNRALLVAATSKRKW